MLRSFFKKTKTSEQIEQEACIKREKIRQNARTKIAKRAAALFIKRKKDEQRRAEEIAEAKHQKRLADLRQSGIEEKINLTQSEVQSLTATANAERERAQARLMNAQASLSEQQLKQDKANARWKCFKRGILPSLLGGAALVGSIKGCSSNGEKLPEGQVIYENEKGEKEIGNKAELEKLGYFEVVWYEKGRLIHSGCWKKGKSSKLGNQNVVVGEKSESIKFNPFEIWLGEKIREKRNSK